MKKINFGKVILRALGLLIVKPFTLPFKIYKNSLINLSSSDEHDSTESILSKDFPIYVWFMYLYDALIVLIYPLGAIMAVGGGIYMAVEEVGASGVFGLMVYSLVLTYFTPLVVSRKNLFHWEFWKCLWKYFLGCNE